MRVVDQVEDTLEHTKVVHEIEEKTHNLSLVKKILHVFAILLIPGFLLGTCVYYAIMVFRR